MKIKERDEEFSVDVDRDNPMNRKGDTLICHSDAFFENFIGQVMRMRVFITGKSVS